MNKCKICNANSVSDYCFAHKPRKKIPQIRQFKTISPQESIKNTEKVKSSLLMKEFFLEIWKERPHYSEISGIFLGNEPLTIFFHHILLKSKTSQAKFDKTNIILLLPEEHQRVHIDMYKYDEINRRREVLLVKYALK